jgi:hypothetical protein
MTLRDAIDRLRINLSGAGLLDLWGLAMGLWMRRFTLRRQPVPA